MTTTAPTSSDEMVVPANMLPVQVTGMQAMASKMWMPLIGMGFMIVFAAFIFGLFNSSVTSDYFDASKADRDAAVRDSDLATDRAFIESTKVWLPTLKFLGMGMILSGVTFLLATILGALRVGGAGVQQALGGDGANAQATHDFANVPDVHDDGPAASGGLIDYRRHLGHNKLRLLEQLHCQRPEHGTRE